MCTDHPHAETDLYPPLPAHIEAVAAAMASAVATAEVDGPATADFYRAFIESQCGATDDSQPVEQYDGTLGVAQAFVAAHQRPVGQLQWDDNLASVYTNPGNVNDVRWCTGTLISPNLFLSAGHCFDSNPSGGWTVPRRNGTNDPIPPAEIAQRMHVNFNFQDDPNGNARPEVEYDVVELVEHRLGNLDFAILRLAGNPGAIFGMGDVAATDPAQGSMLAIIGHPAGVPKRIEAGPLTSFDGNLVRYNDIDTLGGNSGSAIWHSPSGSIAGVHTNGGCNTSGSGSNFGVRISRVREESLTLRSLDAAPLPVAPGLHTVRQESSGRFMDAHEAAAKDFKVVTRPAQGNDSQRWRFTPVGAVYTIRQASSGRFVDAHEIADKDFAIVTRPDQGNDTQRWVALPLFGHLSTYTLQQLSSRRFMDAHESAAKDFAVVTRPPQANDTQRWVLAPGEDGAFTVVQLSSARFVDAHEITEKDFAVVTRPSQANDTQRWLFTPVAGVYTIQQVNTDRFMDAHEVADKDFATVTRPAQVNDSQRWVVSYLGGDSYTLQQLSSGRFLDAHEIVAQDFSVVTRPGQDNDTQRWIIG
ncbi:MAG: RICIN domain-containing protein [Acidimicrobiales bacterium]